MNNFKIGDRVRVISIPNSFTAENPKIKMGLMGTVKDLNGAFVGVEFDEDMGGHNGSWNGKQGYCWYIEDENLEKIDEIKKEVIEEIKEEGEEMGIAEETKTFEQKILEVLREEIGVEIGEEFDVYKKGNMLWRCKFEENGFFRRGWDEFQKAEVWKNIIANFHEYTFKRKPFIPDYEEKYVFLFLIYDRNNNIKVDVATTKWIDNIMDYGMLVLGNVFRSKTEALASKDKLLEKLIELRQGE